MKCYLSVIRIRFMQLLQYRAAALAGICAPFLFGIVQVMVFYAFYHSTSAPQSMSYEQAVSYIWLGQALLGIIPWSGDGEIVTLVRTGNVAYELCRPMNLYFYWFSRALALRTAPTLLRAIPIFAITMLLPEGYDLELPYSLGAAAAWISTLAGAVLIAAAITSLIDICTLWTVSGDGIARLLPAVIIIGSGLNIPIPMFPVFVQKVLRFLPFCDLVDTPSRLYTGNIAASAVLPHLVHEALWLTILMAIGQWLVNRAMKRVAVQGG